MKHFPYTIDGDETMTYVPETSADLREFRAFVEHQARNGLMAALDTETTGLDIYSPTYGLRTVQLGNAIDAYVLQVEGRPEMAEAARWALTRLPKLVVHNAAFDLLVLDRHLSMPLEELAPRVTDSKILAHLFDPRLKQEGGTGLGLKELSALHVDPAAPDTQADLTAVFRSIGETKATGWRAIDINHPTYLQYAGLDVILASRLLPVLEQQLRKVGVSQQLVNFEHRVMTICCKMMRRGMRVDQDYVRALVGRLEEEAERHTAKAAQYGVTSVNATAQVSAALVGMGETLTEKTPSGALKVDKAILLDLADLDTKWQPRGTRTPNPLADAVLHAKRAGKWRTSYGVAMRDGLDADGRIHCNVNSLQARTARMSISGPPLQQLPSGDWTIRRALLADEGHRVISVDYSAVEMRVLAALADEPVMKQAIADGRDLHGFTAELIYGPDYTSFHRKLCKGVGFGKVYGGGALTLSRQTGAPLPDVKKAIAAYDRTYRGIKRYSNHLQREARARGFVVRTPVGRRLPLDRDRVYAATNYMVQSTARDVLCQALLDMDDKGLTEYLLLPIHDEVLASAPEDVAEDVAAEIAKTMSMDFFGVPLDADLTDAVSGYSWGSGYMKDAETMMANDEWYAAHPEAARAAELARA
ncbi:DNA polymerase [Streptomyces asiaticus]|uniref:DNA polymerase n=1 Tax=Streptomyces asiaticus TaxID=114695 RepID=UPI0027E30777|nr:DNA polymerase [Streptomyces asiaticus]